MRRISALLLLLFGLALYTLPAEAFLIGGVPSAGGTVPSTCGGYTPPLDTQSGAAAAYSFRLLRTAYSGGNIVTVQRSSDSTQKTFTATVPGCGINTADSFFDGSTYTVVTLYDQSGNGANITQATNSQRPTVNLNCQNSHPCAVFAQASAQFLTGTLAAAVGADTFTAVAKLTDQTNTRFLTSVGTAGANYTNLAFAFGTTTCNATKQVSSAGFGATSACANNTWFRWVGILNSSLSRIYLNGTVGTDNTTSSGALVGQTPIYLGQAGNNGNYWNGNAAELIVFAPDLSPTNALAISTNQSSYWGI